MQKKILVTDDAMYMRLMLKEILIQNKYAVFEASNGQEAIDQYDVHQPDLVFMDITMPVVDGIAATRAIRNQASKRAYYHVHGNGPAANGDRCRKGRRQRFRCEAIRAQTHSGLRPQVLALASWKPLA